MTALQALNPFLLLAVARRHCALLCQLTQRQMAARYRGSTLGYLWMLSHPLLMLTIYTFVFGVVFKSRWGTGPNDSTGDFAVVMFCGMAVFNIFSETVNGCTQCVITNANLVKKVIFPLEILPLAQLLSTTVLSLSWFVLLLAGALALGMRLTWTILLFPALLLPLMLFSLGLGYFVAATTVYLRDMPHFTAIATQVLFFMTPIFYRIDMVPERLRFILLCNPLTPMVDQIRAVLLFGRPPDWQTCALLWLVSWFVCHLGLLWFLKTKKGFADVL